MVMQTNKTTSTANVNQLVYSSKNRILRIVAEICCIPLYTAGFFITSIIIFVVVVVVTTVCAIVIE